MDAGQIVVRLLADARALDRGLLASERRIGSFSRQVTRTGDSMTRTLTAGILGAAGATSYLSLQFDKQFNLIGGLVGVSAKQLERYKQQVLDMAPALGKAPQELAEALYFITSSGFEGAAAMRVLEASAKASAAGLGDTAVVADAVTSAVNAYGEKVLSASRATDILLAAVREGKAEPEELAASIGQVIPAASQMGVGFDQVAAALASMTLTGQSASEAAVALNQVFTNALKPTKQGADTLAEVGLSYKALRESLAKDGLLDTLGMLNERFDGNVEAMARVFGNVRSLRAVFALTGAAADKTSGIFAELAENGNDTNKAFAEMAQTDGFKLQQAWAELQATAIEFGAVVVPMLVDVVEAGTDLVQWLDDLDEGTKETVVKIALFAAAIGPALSMIGRMGTGVATLASAYGKLAGSAGKAAAAQLAVNASQGATVKGKTPAVPAMVGGAAGMGRLVSLVPVAAIIAAIASAIIIGTKEGVEKAREVHEQGASDAKSAWEGIKEGILAPGKALEEWMSESTDSIAKVGEAWRTADAAFSGAWGLQRQRLNDLRADYGRLLEVLRKEPDFLGDIDASHTVAELNKIRDAIMSKLNVTKRQANKMMADLFDDWEIDPGTFTKSLDMRIGDVQTRLARLKAILAKKIRWDPLGDYSGLQQKIARLERQLERLNDKKVEIEVDVKAKAAEAYLNKFKGGRGRGSGMGATIEFEAETGKFDAAAKRVQSKAKAVGGLKPEPTVGVNDQATPVIDAIGRALGGLPTSKTITITTNKVTRDIERAYGGIDYLTSATRFVAGEAGPEISAVFPLGNRARTADLYGQLTAQLAPYLGSSQPAGGGSSAAAVSATGAAPLVGQLVINVPPGADEVQGYDAGQAAAEAFAQQARVDFRGYS
jgi:TP901 family phage tail tape measure protein